MGSGAVDVEAKRRTLLDVISSQVDKSYDDVVTRVTYTAKFLSICNAAAAVQLFGEIMVHTVRRCSTAISQNAHMLNKSCWISRR